jgi:pimeloyl-ACP methyl ester carboxylesterase
MLNARPARGLAVVVGVFGLTLASGSMSAPAGDPQGRYAEVNGIRMYYEVHDGRTDDGRTDEGRADGVPLVLLHGGGSTIDSTFGRILPFLARNRRVIAVEEQAHGRTSDRNQPVRFETSAEDVATLLNQLKISKADLFGFSNGASVALQVAIRHPGKVRKLVFASSFTRKDGAVPELWTFMKQANFSNMPQPLKDAFLKVNPDPAKLRVMHDKDLDRMLNFKDVPDADVRSVRASTLVLSGDRDVAKLEHTVELTRLIPNARLLILEGGHGDYMGEVITPPRNARYPELTAGLVEQFLDEPYKLFP